MRHVVNKKLPPYFEQMIPAFERGESGRFVHLGHWDSPPFPHPPVTAKEFAAAQQRLNDVLVDMGELVDGHSILDVGCGFGGTIESLNARHEKLQMTGLNIDPRQLSICERIDRQNENQLTWCEADACNMPFSACSFDRIFCIEAMFHFDSRTKFFKDVARTLRPDGVLVASDIYVNWAEVAEVPHGREIAARIQEEYGPWPDPSGPSIDYQKAATDNNLRVEVLYDASSHIAPSYAFIAPGAPGYDIDQLHAVGGAAYCLKHLHRINLLKYWYIKLRKPRDGCQ